MSLALKPALIAIFLVLATILSIITAIVFSQTGMSREEYYGHVPASEAPLKADPIPLDPFKKPTPIPYALPAHPI